MRDYLNPWVLFVAGCAWVLDALWGDKASTRRYARKWRNQQRRQRIKADARFLALFVRELPQAHRADPPGFQAMARHREDGR